MTPLEGTQYWGIAHWRRHASLVKGFHLTQEDDVVVEPGVSPSHWVSFLAPDPQDFSAGIVLTIVVVEFAAVIPCLDRRHCQLGHHSDPAPFDSCLPCRLKTVPWGPPP
jgi:hypothetical protein